MIHPSKCTPNKHQLFILEDPQQTETYGGLILTEKLPTEAEVGFSTGTIYKAGDYAHLLMGLPHTTILDNPLEGKRVVFRKYLAEACRFNEKIDSKNVFMIRAEDIVALVKEGVQVHAI